MARFKLTIEYHGGNYVGWQRQAVGASVQQTIEEALFAFTGEDVRLSVAGRTDTGVHAMGQVAHGDISRKMWSANRVREALNAFLRDKQIAILKVETVPESFDARFSALGRRYLYRIINRRPPLGLESGLAWHVSAKLDENAMHAAAQRLLGHHDFTTFRAAACQAKSPEKTLDLLDVTRQGDLIEIRAAARSFLHSQVRSLVGTLAKVGRGQWSVDRPYEILLAKDRALCGALAPPGGLYLTGVDYAAHPVFDVSANGEETVDPGS